MKRAFVCFIWYLVFNSVLFAQESRKSVSFSGGMFLHSGYYFHQNNFKNGLTQGLGGILKIHLNDHFYTGMSGGNIRRNYDTPESEFSFVDFGYGGLLGGWYHEVGKRKFSVQIFTGIGKMSQLFIPSQVGDQLIDASYKKNIIWLLAPSFGFEYFLSKRISLLLQTEVISAFQAGGNEFLLPLIRVGILFNR